MNSFRTRTNWLFWEQSVREAVDEDVYVVVDNNVRGRVGVDDEQSGFPETIHVVLMNSFRTRTNWLFLEQSVREAVDEDVYVVVDNNVRGRVGVDDEQSGFPETIHVVLMNSFRTRTNWLFLEQSVREAVDEDVYEVVDNNVHGRVGVDDEQSGFPETIRLVMNNIKTRTIWLRLLAFWIWEQLMYSIGKIKLNGR